MGQSSVDVSVNRLAVWVNALRSVLQISALVCEPLPPTGRRGYGSVISSHLDAMSTLPAFAVAILLIGAGSASAMEPLQLSSGSVDSAVPSAVSAAVNQEQASLNASCRELRAQAGSADQPLLEQGPRHPHTSPLLSVGF